jgi:hypothetical protein
MSGDDAFKQAVREASVRAGLRMPPAGFSIPTLPPGHQAWSESRDAHSRSIHCECGYSQALTVDRVMSDVDQAWLGSWAVDVAMTHGEEVRKQNPDDST